MSENDNSRRSVLNLERVYYVLQKKNPVTGEWRTDGGHILGRTEALAILNQEKAKRDPNVMLRVIPKTDAECYRQGWKEALEFAYNHPDIEKLYEKLFGNRNKTKNESLGQAT